MSYDSVGWDVGCPKCGAEMEFYEQDSDKEFHREWWRCNECSIIRMMTFVLISIEDRNAEAGEIYEDGE